MNLTLVSVPLPFRKNQLTITHQNNAIRSWTLLEPQPDIVLLGDDFGVGAAAEKFRVRHQPKIGVNKLGDLSMRSIFNKADDESETEWICYIDTDVILLDDFMPTFEYLVERYHDFVSCAGRWDAHIENDINFGAKRWQRYVRGQVFKLCTKGSDYCIYRRGFYHNMPDFSIGKGAWDGWRMGYPKTVGVPLINVEAVCKAVHQHHGLRWKGSPSSARNKRLTKGRDAWIKDADIFVTDLNSA